MFIEDTPFFTGKLQNGMWAIGCGNARTSAVFKTAKQAEAYVRSQKIDWQMLGIFVSTICNQIKNQK